MIKTLTIHTGAGEKIAKLVWRDGAVIVECCRALNSDADKWIRNGLDEWIGVGEDAVPRSTPASAPEFLARLGGYLQRHYGFQTILESDG